MQYVRIIHRINSSTWVSTPETLDSIHRTLKSHHRKLPATIADDPPQDGLKPALIRSTQVIPVQGILGKHLSGLEPACGGCSVELLEHRIQQAFDNSLVKNIVLYFDSPGGSVTGILELADFIRDGRSKPICAFTDSVMASGAKMVGGRMFGHLRHTLQPPKTERSYGSRHSMKDSTAVQFW